MVSDKKGNVAETVHINTQYDTGFGRFRLSGFVQIVYVYAIVPAYACVEIDYGKIMVKVGCGEVRQC